MQTINPTPTCTRFDAAHLACNRCGRQMRLVLAEPYKPDSALELRTFECSDCGNGESYLMQV
jgi:ribosomal protein L37E